MSESSLRVVLDGLQAVNCRGLNVTIPHKQSIARLCTELSPLAQRLGAVNTLIPLTNGGWHGTNTDVEGFLAPLGPADALDRTTGRGDRLWWFRQGGGGWPADPSARLDPRDRTPR